MLDGVVTGEGLIVAGDVNWTDYYYSAKGRILSDSDNNELALVVRYVDVNNFIWAGLGCWGHRVSISRKVNGVSQELVFAGLRTEVVPGKDYVIAVRAVGNLLELYVDGVFELAVQDSSLPKGSIGIRHYSSHVELDYVDATVPLIRHTLTIGSSAGGITNPVAGIYEADEGTTAIVTAVPNGGYRFLNWLLDGANRTENPISVLMNVNHSLMPVFGRIQHSLFINATANGTTIPESGTYSADEGSGIIVTAVPNSGYRFVNWMLDIGPATDNPITVVMDVDHSITPVFEFIVIPPEKRSLTIVAGAGGTTDPLPNTYEVDLNAIVPVTATPSNGYKFKEWLLDNVQAGTQPFITVTMDVNHTLVATFAEETKQAGFPLWVIPVVLIGMGAVYVLNKKK